MDADGPVALGVNTDLITSGVGTASVTGGSVTLGNNASLVSAASVVLTTDAVSLSALNASINAGTGSVAIKPMTAGTAINLGGWMPRAHSD